MHRRHHADPAPSRRTRWHWRRAATLGLMIACGVAAFVATSQSGVGHRFELSTVDARFELRGATQPAPESVAIVKINDETDTSLGRFPYPRRFYADAIRALHEAGARAVVLDVNFDFASGSATDDRELVTAARQNQPVVFVTAPQSFDTTSYLPNEPLQGITFRGVEAGEAFRWSGSTFGLANVRSAADGSVREWDVRVPHRAVDGRDGTRPSLALAALDASGERPRTRLPNKILVNYTTPAREYTQLNLTDVLSGRHLERVAGRTVFIGATSDVLHDVHETPIDEQLPGVMLHAQVFENLRTGTWLEPAPGWVAYLAAALLVGLWITALTFLPLIRGLIVAALGMTAYAGVVHVLFVERLIVAPLAAPLVAGIATGFSVLAVIAWRELRDRRRVTMLFSRYVAPEVVRELLTRSDVEDLVSGTRREISVLFADIRGFTAMSEHADPDQLVNELNDYLGAMTDAIHSCGGTIDKFMGDGIMAIFGAPLDQPDHADRACEAAAAMLTALDSCNAQRTRAGRPAFRIGIGIATGTAVVGSIGSQRRLDYTAIGDCVNLAARIERETQRLGVPIVVSGDTAAAVTRTQLATCGSVTVRGRAQSTELFAVGDVGTRVDRAA